MELLGGMVGGTENACCEGVFIRTRSHYTGLVRPHVLLVTTEPAVVVFMHKTLGFSLLLVL